jgi:hypothetical protein
MNRGQLLVVSVALSGVVVAPAVRAQNPTGQGGWFPPSQQQPAPPPTSTVPPGVILVDPQQAPPPAPQQPYIVIQPTAQPQPLPPPAPPQATSWKPTNPPPAEDEDRETAPRPSIKLEVGAAYRRLLGLSVAGADFRFGFGSQTNRMGHYVMVDFFYGATESSLRTWTAMLGYNLDVRLGIVRLGLGFEGGALVVRRASLDKRMYSWGGGAYLHVGADIAQFGRNGSDAFYVDVRFGGSLHYGGVGFWGPSLMVGLRL